MTDATLERVIGPEIIEAPGRPVPTTRRPDRRRRLPDLAAYGSYLLFGIGVLGHVWRDPNRRVLTTNPGDHTFFEWNLAHGLRVLTGQESPLVSHAINAPDGVNMMANTSILGLSIPLAPVTWLFGPAVSFALLATLALAGTAAAWYYVLSRYLVRSRPAAYLGGLLAGFAPGVVAHANGQPNITAQFLVPFLVLVTLRLHRRPVRNGLLLGLLSCAQALINEEVLLLAVLGLGVLVAVLAVADPPQRRHARRLLGGLGVAVLLAGTVLAYPLYQQFFGAQSYRGLPFPPSTYATDALAFLTYARESVGGNAGISAISPSPNEDNAAFGWALLALAAVTVLLLWRRPLVRALGITAVVFGALALGPQIEVAGRVLPIPGPYRLVEHIPPVDLAIPGRFALVLAPIMAVLVALGVQYAFERVGTVPDRPGHWRAALAILVTAAVLPTLPTPLPAADRAPVPAFIAHGDWRAYVPAGRTIVTVPLPAYRNPSPMYWQAMTGQDFPLPRGYFLGPASRTDQQAIFGAPPRPTATRLYAISVLPRLTKGGSFADTPIGGSVTKPTTDPATVAAIAAVTDTDRANARADLAYWRAAIVILPFGQPNEELLWKATSELLGTQPVAVGGVWLWDVRKLVPLGSG